MSSSGTTHISLLASHRGSSSALDRRGWNLALTFQEVFTAIVRLRYNRQAVTNADSFRAQMRQALRVAEQEARTRGYSAEDTRQAVFAVVGFLDESVLGCRNAVFADWPRLPLQAEMFGHQLAGEVFFQELQKVLTRPDTNEAIDLLEVYQLCLRLGFKGRYAAGGSGELASIMAAIQEKIRRVRGPSLPLSPRGVVPADAVRVARSDPWVRRLAIGSISMALLTAALLLVFKFSLISGASQLSSLASRAMQ